MTLSALVDLFPYGEVWRPFFPGVFGGLVRVIVGDFKQGSQLTGLALGLLLDVTTLVTASKTNATILSKGSASHGLTALMQLRGPLKGDIGDHKEEGGDEGDCWMPPQVYVTPSEEWATGTIHQLSQLFPAVLRVCRGHPKARVLSQLMEGATCMLRESCRFFQDLGGEEGEAILTLLLDTIVGMQQDEHEALAAQARAATTEMMSWLPSAVTSGVLDRLVDLFLELPVSASSTDGQTLRIAVDLITGYVQALNQRKPPCLPQVLCTSVGVIMEALGQVLEFDRPQQSQSRVLQVIDSLPPEGPPSSAAATLGYYRSHLHHFRDTQCLASARTLLEALGASGHEFVYLVVDHVIGQLKGGGPKRRQRRTRKETIMTIDGEHKNEDEEGAPGLSVQVQWVVDRLPQVFIMNGVLRGSKTLSSSSVQPIVRYLLDEMVVPRRGVWHVATSAEATSKPTTAELLDCRALLISLLLEGMGDAAEALGKDHFDSLLQYTLYGVLAKSGDPHPVVRQAAITTLHRFAVILDQGSIRGLLSNNVDYILQSLYSQVRQGTNSSSSSPPTANAFPVGPGVMESLLTYTQQSDAGGGAPFALMREMSSMVLGILDDQCTAVLPNSKYLHGMMKVLLAMVRAILVQPENASLKRSGRVQRQPVRVEAGLYWHHRIVQDLGRTRKTEDVDTIRGNAQEYFRKHHANKKARETGEPTEDEDKEEEELLEIEKLLGPIPNDVNLNPEQEDEEPDDKPSPQEEVILEVLNRCSYFLASPSLLVQHTVVQVMLEGLAKIKYRRYILLPTLHKLWPSLMARLHACTDLVMQSRPQPGMDITVFESSQSFAMALIIGVLTMMGEVTGLVGDFLSIKFTEDVWPIMRKLLMLCEKKSQIQGLLSPTSLRVITTKAVSTFEGPGTAGSGGSSTALDRKLLEALVRCLNQICRVDECYQFLTPMVNEIAQVCSFLFQHPHAMGQEEDPIIDLYQCLARFDRDAIWVVAMEGAGCDLSQRPLRFPAGSGGGGALGVAALKKKRAVTILKFVGNELKEGVWCTISPEEKGLLGART